jgi:hypothetical protein
MGQLSPLFHEDGQIFVFPALLSGLGERCVGRFGGNLSLSTRSLAHGQTGEDESRFMGFSYDGITV